MRKGWEIRISIILFILGGSCLFASTTLPFSVKKRWFQNVHLLEISILILLAIFLIGLYLNNRSQKPKIPCYTCQYPISTGWQYCPQCGKQVSK